MPENQTSEFSEQRLSKYQTDFTHRNLIQKVTSCSRERMSERKIEFLLINKNGQA